MNFYDLRFQTNELFDLKGLFELFVVSFNFNWRTPYSVKSSFRKIFSTLYVIVNLTTSTTSSKRLRKFRASLKIEPISQILKL